LIFLLDTDILIDLLRHYPPSGTPNLLFTDETRAMPTSAGGQLSPEGCYLTYESNDRDSLRPVWFPSLVAVASDRCLLLEGCYCRNPQGGELFYVEPQGNGESRSMMSVSIDPQRVPKPGRPNKRCDLPQRVITLFIAMTTDSYDISSDGQQFLLAQQEKGSEQPEIAVTVVQNWYKELQDHK